MAVIILVETWAESVLIIPRSAGYSSTVSSWRHRPLTCSSSGAKIWIWHSIFPSEILDGVWLTIMISILMVAVSRPLMIMSSMNQSESIIVMAVRYYVIELLNCKYRHCVTVFVVHLIPYGIHQQGKSVINTWSFDKKHISFTSEETKLYYS